MRVTGGALRGRSIRVPAGRGVRPTTDRVRESLFAILGPLEGARVLDVFAGSGSLGIEALSRGASHADFIERSAPALACLRRNLDSLGLAGQSRVQRGDARSVLARFRRQTSAGEAPYDLVLMDPPYESPEGPEALKALAGSGLLAADSVVVFEASRRHPPGGAHGLVELDRRTYGDTLLIRFGPEPPDAAEPRSIEEPDPSSESSRSEIEGE